MSIFVDTFEVHDVFIFAHSMNIEPRAFIATFDDP